MSKPETTLVRLRELAERATAGRWHPVGNSVYVDSRPILHMLPWPVLGREPQHHRDAAFIAAASPAMILTILDEIERLRSGNVRLGGVVDHAGAGGCDR